MTAQLALELFTQPDDEAPPAAPPAKPAGSAPAPDLTTVVDGIMASVRPVFEAMEWAEDEIAAAARRHPGQADRLFHAFLLLQPTHDRMATEFVYRSLARELLERAAAGGDTRPGTTAEVVCALMETSKLAPLRSAAVGLYMRMWIRAGFPPIGDDFEQAAAHHEALEASTIDDYEAFARRRLALPDRRLGEIDCMGEHHGEPASGCRYTRPAVIDGEVTA